MQTPRRRAANLDLGKGFTQADEAADLELYDLAARPILGARQHVHDRGIAILLDLAPNLTPAGGVELRPDVSDQPITKF